MREHCCAYCTQFIYFVHRCARRHTKVLVSIAMQLAMLGPCVRVPPVMFVPDQPIPSSLSFSS